VIAIVGMGMTVYPAGAVIQQVCTNDQDYGRDKQPGEIMNEKLFHNKEGKACQEKEKGCWTVVMFPVTMVKGIASDGECEHDHSRFKRLILNDIDPEKGEAAQEHGQQGTVNSTGQRSADSKGIPVYSNFHEGGQKYEKSNIVAKLRLESYPLPENHLLRVNFAANCVVMSRKTVSYLVFFVALVSVFYLVVRRWIKPNDTISVVQPFSFTNQDGKQVTEKDVAGKVYVAEYFFTTCTGICPRMNKNMKKVYEEFKDEPGFLILSHTCQPEVDSVHILKKYADSMGVDTRKWIFLTGRKDSLYTMARVSYTIDDPVNNLKDIKDDFLHTQFWALVDGEGKVKKVYDALEETEVEAMMRRIKRMLH
jgi:protein SCO1/2